MNEQLEYLTGEIAQYFSLTNMGVHHLEKKGVIQSSRKENGYRIYNANELTKLGEIKSYERMGFSLNEANSFRYDYSLKKEKVQHKLEELAQQIELLKYYESLFVDDVIKVNDFLTSENTKIESSICLYWYPCWEEQYDLHKVSQKRLTEMKKIDCSWLAAMPYMLYCTKVNMNDSLIQTVRGNSIDEEYAKKENVVITSYIEKYNISKALTFICEMNENQYDVVLDKVKDFMDYSVLENFAFFRILETAIPENKNYMIAKVIIPFK